MKNDTYKRGRELLNRFKLLIDARLKLNHPSQYRQLLESGKLSWHLGRQARRAVDLMGPTVDAGADESSAIEYAWPLLYAENEQRPSIDNSTQIRLAQWLHERTEQRHGAWESATALFNDWRKWAEANHETVGSPKRFSMNLAAQGWKRHRKNTNRGFSGIMLKTEIATPGDGSGANRHRTGAQKSNRHRTGAQKSDRFARCKGSEECKIWKNSPLDSLASIAFAKNIALICEACPKRTSPARAQDAYANHSHIVAERDRIPVEQATVWLMGRAVQYYQLVRETWPREEVQHCKTPDCFFADKLYDEDLDLWDWKTKPAIEQAKGSGLREAFKLARHARNASNGDSPFEGGTRSTSRPRKIGAVGFGLGRSR